MENQLSGPRGRDFSAPSSQLPPGAVPAPTTVPIPGPDWDQGGRVDLASLIRRYLWLFYSRMWLLLAAALLGATIAGVKSFRQPRMYVAQATVEFQQAVPPGKDLDILQRRLFVPPELAQRLLTTKVLAARVINNARERGEDWFGHMQTTPPSKSVLQALRESVSHGLAAASRTVRSFLTPPTPAPRVAVQPTPPEPDLQGVNLGLIGQYYSYIQIRPVTGTSLVDIVVTHPDPSVAAAIANEHAKTFVDMDIETKTASLSDAQGLFGRQLADVLAQLEASRKALSDYQLEHGILTLPKDSTTLTRQSVQQLNHMLTEAEAARIKAESDYRYAASLPPERLVETMDDKGLREIRENILALEARYEAQLQDYGVNHPDMSAMQATIKSLQARLEQATARTLEGLRTKYEAALAREQKLRKNLEALSRAATEEERELVRLMVLQRDVASNEELYTNLLEKAKESNLAAGTFHWTNVTQVDQAVVPSVPTYPRTREDLKRGFLFGLLCGIVLVLVLDRLDNTLHTPEQLDEVLGLPTLGVIPDFARVSSAARYGYGTRTHEEPPSSGVGRELVTLVSPASLASEAYRTVRTNLLFSSPGGPPRAVLITSSQAGEGKTITTVNLGIILALSGSRVLIIDADLRKPGCHHCFRVPCEPGLSNVLSGQCDLEAAIVRPPLSPRFSEQENGHGLHVLPAGRIPPDPAELLSSAVMTQLLEIAKGHFDFVLLDSPPILPVTDSVLLAAKADAVMLVVRAGTWGRDVVVRALKQLQSVRARTLGVVLNCVHIGPGGSHYSSYYHYRGYHSYYRSPAGQDSDNERATPT